MQHPNIVRFFGLEQDVTLAFMLMDYIDGQTLRSLIARRKSPLTNSQVWQIMRSICSALHYAHGMGMLHCDVKPANIMIDQDGMVY